MSTYTHTSGDADLNTWMSSAGSGFDYQNSNSSVVLSGNTRIFGSGLTFGSVGLTAGRVDRMEYVDPNSGSVTQIISGINMDISTSGQSSGISVSDMFWGTSFSSPTYSQYFFGALSGNDLIQGNDSQDYFRGTAGNDTIYGYGGDDSIYGDVQNLNIPEEFGSDVIYGGNGNDRIWAGRGDDFIDGGDGNDLLVGNDSYAAYAGASAYQYLPGRDTIFGGNGNDLVYAQIESGMNSDTGNFYSYIGGVVADGGAGFDRLFANFSHITADMYMDWRNPSNINHFTDGSSIVNFEELGVITGSGNDTIYDGAYMDQIATGAGNDTVYYGGTQLFPRDGLGYYGASINLGSGHDRFVVNNIALGYADGSTPPIDGGDGFDTAIFDYSSSITSRNVSAASLLNFESINYAGGSAGDNVLGTDGGDVINGGAGSDQLIGGGGNDLLVGGDGGDELYGGADSDVLTGQAGGDRPYGGEGNDTLIGGDGADQLDGGDGTDYSFYGNSAAVIVNLSTGIGKGGEAEGDTYVSIEGVTGSEFADNLTGNALANELVGGGGNDVLEGLAGGDVLVGGAGIDTASYLSSDDTVAVNLTNLSGAGGHAAGDILVGIENVTGSAYGDLLRGDAGANVLFGAAGGDLLFGEAGDDVLVGGAGGDIMTGGAGNDTFLFRPEFEVAGDIVVDFDQNGDDVLMFSGFGAGFAASLQTAVVNGSDVVVYSAAWDSHVVLQNAVGRVDASDFLFV